MRRVGLTLQIPGPATSTGDELIQRPCERSRMWIGLERPEIVNTQADQYRQVGLWQGFPEDLRSVGRTSKSDMTADCSYQSRRALLRDGFGNRDRFDSSNKIGLH